jgi:hypothetical protein
MNRRDLTLALSQRSLQAVAAAVTWRGRFGLINVSLLVWPFQRRPEDPATLDALDFSERFPCFEASRR